MTKTEKILRKRTMNLFNDDWYEATSMELLNIKNKTYGYVYFIKSEYSSDIKIGKTINMKNRMSSLRTAISSDVFLLGYIFTDKFNEIEKNLHKKYIGKLVQGEWFSISDDEAINDIKMNNGIVTNSFVGTKAKFIEGSAIGLVNTPKPFKPFWDMFINELEKVKLNVNHPKAEFYEKIINLDKKYSTLSKKKVVLICKEYCEKNNLIYHQSNSSGVRYFKIMNK